MQNDQILPLSCVSGNQCCTKWHLTPPIYKPFRYAVRQFCQNKTGQKLNLNYLFSFQYFPLKMNCDKYFFLNLPILHADKMQKSIWPCDFGKIKRSNISYILFNFVDMILWMQVPDCAFFFLSCIATTICLEILSSFCYNCYNTWHDDFSLKGFEDCRPNPSTRQSVGWFS